MKTPKYSSLTNNPLRVLLWSVALFFATQNILLAQDDCFLAWESGTPNVESPYCQEPNGVIEVSATGQGLVTYQINNGPSQTSGLFENLSTGTYTITATDELGCEIELIVFLEGQKSIEIQGIATTPSECDQPTGSITVNATGLGLQYSINNSAYQMSNTFNNLWGGIYTVRIRDVNNCIQITQVTVQQGSISLNHVDVTPTTCVENNGQIIVDAAGNDLEYRLEGLTSWQLSPVFSNLAPGYYWLEIRDNQGCILRKRYYISNTTIINIQVENPLCGENYGTITINVFTSGTYEYSIDGGQSFQSSNVFTNVPVGTYPIVIRLVGSNCIINRTISVDVDPDITIQITSNTRPTCNNSDGQIIAVASGDVQGFQISSDNYSESNTTGVFNNLPQGLYTITVTSQNECSVSSTVNLIDFNDISLNSIVTTPSSCIEPQGTITVNATSTSNEPLTYSIDGVNFQSDSVFDVLIAGPYTVTIQSSSGCTIEELVTVPADNPINIREISTSVPSSVCTSDGEIIILADGVDLEYSIDNVNWQSSNTFSNLPTNTYIVYIRSLETGCSTQTGDILLEGSFYIENIEITNTFCERPEGQALVYAIGIEMMYSVDDGPFQSDPLLTGISVGPHTITVRDFFGCEVQQDIEITSLGNVTFTGYDIFYPECSDNNAAVSLSVETESRAIEYWYEGIEPTQDNTFYSLPRGVTRFFARDEYGCTDTIDVNILETSQVVNSASTDDYICFNRNGSITVYHDGGLPPFRYSLNNVSFQDDNTITGLREGEYTVYIRDRAGCPSQITVEVGYQCEAMVPNAFTPGNNDGVNDRLVLLHERNLLINEFRVYNSWGEVVYEKRDFWSQENNDMFWNGIDHNAQDGDQNVFLYQVIFEDVDGSTNTLKGVVHLIH